MTSSHKYGLNFDHTLSSPPTPADPFFPSNLLLSCLFESERVSLIRITYRNVSAGICTDNVSPSVAMLTACGSLERGGARQAFLPSSVIIC